MWRCLCKKRLMKRNNKVSKVTNIVNKPDENNDETLLSITVLHSKFTGMLRNRHLENTRGHFTKLCITFKTQQFKITQMIAMYIQNL